MLLELFCLRSLRRHRHVALFGIRHHGLTNERDRCDPPRSRWISIEVDRPPQDRTPSGVEAVEGIDFEVAPGEVFGLLGPNGAGKSTTVGMLTTTHPPDARHRQDRRLRRGGRAARGPRFVSSVVFQEPVVDRSLTGRRNLELHARLWGVRARRGGSARIDELALTRSGCASSSIGPPEPTAAASAGGSRSPARSSRPRVLFLDEPTVGLDPRIRAELLDVIAGLRSRDELTVLLTTHYLDEAEQLADRVAIIHAGRIVALDTPRALLARSRPRARRAARRRGPSAPRSPRSASAASPATTPSPSARASPCRSTPASSDERSPPSTSSASPRDQRARSRRSTTSTCASPATRSPRRLTAKERTDVRREIASSARSAARSLGPLATRPAPLPADRAHAARALVPLLTPIMFALVIAPALKTALHTEQATSPSSRSARSDC